MAPAPAGSPAPREASPPRMRTCAVCLDEFLPAQLVVFIPCGHRATCRNCAERLLAGSSRLCPIDRREVSAGVRAQWLAAPTMVQDLAPASLPKLVAMLRCAVFWAGYNVSCLQWRAGRGGGHELAEAQHRKRVCLSHPAGRPVGLTCWRLADHDLCGGLLPRIQLLSRRAWAVPGAARLPKLQLAGATRIIRRPSRQCGEACACAWLALLQWIVVGTA